MKSDKPQYPEWFINLLQDVLDMRDAQVQYFQHSNDKNLKIAKLKEQRVDDKLSAFVKHNYIKHRSNVKTNQTELFI
jgi:hypothetical protein